MKPLTDFPINLDTTCKSINFNSIIEYIEEQFSNALIYFTDDSIIYGGAIRDLITGMKIQGDLDVAVPYNNYHLINGRFLSSSNWNIEKNIDTILKGYGVPHIRKIIKSISNFIDMDKKSVQLMRVTETDLLLKGFNYNTIKLVQHVDITCCGLFSDIYGNVYECVKNAHQDCIDKVLNINNNIVFNEYSIKKLKERIEKLEKRGWKNNININKIKIKEKK